ncbi:SGNH/GDSL hydrolase family protein [Myxacorys almedinensis]|uniref:Uncharacterized protein n=1 Tax=Myxacorys almedinensis A TaxID=2690445 RepID=A0A8J8CJ70_9CYAN|nr:SGNH/GDSL hydrolase family protein [Myxacorys almedinensis]NDJ17301.1 hypothetical protein [Myxacorys almedinensis A]
MNKQLTLNFDFPNLSVSLPPDLLSFDLSELSRKYTVELSDAAPLIDAANSFLRELSKGGSFSWSIDLKALGFDCQPAAPPISQLVIFGDSLSDRGNLFGVTSQQFPPSPPYFEGRFANGLIWADYLAPQLGIDSDRISSFAVGGAKTGRENIATTLFGLPESLNLPGVLDQIDTFAATTGAYGADPHALYVVWAGSNDLLNLPPDPQGAIAGIRQAVSNISTAITKLADLGAERVLVPNSIDLGLAPFPRRNGVAAQATQASIGFNQALNQALTALEPALGIDIIEVDLFSITQRIAASPGEFGFTNITDPLIEQPNSSNPDGYFWWDQIHPTTQVHQLAADAFEAAIAQSAPVSNGRTQASPTERLIGNGVGLHHPLVTSPAVNRFAESPLFV